MCDCVSMSPSLGASAIVLLWDFTPNKSMYGTTAHTWWCTHTHTHTADIHTDSHMLSPAVFTGIRWNISFSYFKVGLIATSCFPRCVGDLLELWKDVGCEYGINQISNTLSFFLSFFFPTCSKLTNHKVKNQQRTGFLFVLVQGQEYVSEVLHFI